MSIICEKGQTTKTDIAYDAIMKLINARGPGIKLPTIQEMCRQFDLSRTPLENAIRSLEDRGLVRSRRGSGIYVTDRARQKTVGVVFGGDIFASTFSAFWWLLLQAVRQQTNGRSLLPRAYLDISEAHGGLGGHAQLVEDLETHRLDGLLLLAPDYRYDEAAELRKHGIPLVVFGGKAPDWRVTHDFASFVSIAARELASHGSGTVAMLGHNTREHQLSLEQELLANGVSPVTVHDWSFETWARMIPGAGSLENCAYKLVQRVLAARDEKPLPGNVVSFDDTMTRGAIAALQHRGIQPNRDIRIISAANTGSPVLESFADDVTQIQFDPAENVRVALKMLQMLMNGDTPPQSPVLVPPCQPAKTR